MNIQYEPSPQEKAKHQKRNGKAENIAMKSTNETYILKKSNFKFESWVKINPHKNLDYKPVSPTYVGW